jgi:pilus assembly protein FimV
MMRIGLVRGLVALLLLPGISHALGLGDVHLNSPLNAPLDAEIELVNATPEDLATLDAKLATKDTFARYGLDWPPFMASVTVTRDRGANGGQVLRVKSTETVTEPFLTLLIEATWARGRLVREYTVLLDPPVFAPNSVTPVQVAPAASVPDTATAGQIRRPAPQETPSQSPQPVAAGGGDSYEVKRGDSLSAIARRLSASTGARTDQLMVSIYRGNASAFEGDMNRLRAGSVLRIPGSDEIAAVSPSEASSEIRRIAGTWAAAGGAANSGRLRLVPPSDSASAGAGSNNSAEVSDLQGRVRDLEGQLTESKRMLELRNTELADLQAKLAASQQQASAQPAQTAPPAQVEAPAPTTEAAAPAATPEAAPETATPTVEPAPTPSETPAAAAEQPKSEPATETPSEEPSLLDSILAKWWLLVGALVLLVLGLVFAKSRGKRKTAEFDDRIGRLAEQGGDRLAEPVISTSDTGRMQAPSLSGSAIPDDILVEESGTHRALQETQDIPLAPTVRTDETISSETAVNLDQGDPLAEADFHMAYGLYDQAADLVNIAIQREPNRRDLKLKLLEVFFVWGNKEQFLATARELSESRAGTEPGEWEKIVIMGKQIAPEDAMFADTGAGGGAVGVDLNLEAGGPGGVDFDPFDVSARMDVTGGGNPDSVDLDLGAALRDPDATGEGLALPSRDSGQTTREMTVKMTPAGSEAPTVEQPALRPLDEPTIREKVEGAMRRKLSSDQTAELALDDLGLELGSLEQTDSSLGLKPIGGPHGPDANAPTMVAGLDENSQRLLRAAAARQAGNGNANPEDSLTEHGASGTWFLTERELGGDVDLTKGRSIDPNSTAAMAKFDMPDEGFDVSSTSRLAAIDRNNLDFPIEPTREQPAMGARKVDLDLGGGIDLSGSATEELAVPDLEPVTLSEVGTKLDLARAYVDMGDPDGARNILTEVLSEGSASQKQEAQRLLESLPG